MAERVEDLNLPNAVVTRIIKECLPEGVSVAREARTALARAASVFVLYLTSGANNAAVQSNRKTITANDVFKALDLASFGFFVDPLKECLEDFKKSQQVRKQMALAKKKENEESSKKASEEGEKVGGAGGEEEVIEIADEEDEDEEMEEQEMQS